MEKILQSLIISHGFFDVYNLNPDKLIKNIFFYLFIILLNLGVILLLPFIGLLIFLGLSSYHFSLDFKYLQVYNYNIYGVLILISTICNINKLLYWINSISKIVYLNNISLVVCFIFSLIIIIKVIKKNYKKLKFFNKNNLIKKEIPFFIVLLIINIFIESPYKFIFYYLGFFHSPLAMIRKSDKYGYNILKYWIYISFLVYYILINIDEKIIENNYIMLCKLGISLLNTHILFNLF